MMEPKVEVWKHPESDFQIETSHTCELVDLKAPNDDADMAATSSFCESLDTKTGVFH